VSTKPMNDSDGTFKDEWKKVPQCLCPKCGSQNVYCRTWESDCGGFEDDNFKCANCGHVWWVEGADA
jgi:hypothetical protein